MMKKLSVFLAMVFIIVGIGNVVFAECDESCTLKANGNGKILVKVYYRGDLVESVGSLGDKVVVKVMTVKPVYMDFHKQGGLVVLSGTHKVKVYYPGCKTTQQTFFVKAGETKVVKVVIGSKVVKKCKVKTPLKASSETETLIPLSSTVLLEKPFDSYIPAGGSYQGGGNQVLCPDCLSGKKIIMTPPQAQKQ